MLSAPRRTRARSSGGYNDPAAEATATTPSRRHRTKSEGDSLKGNDDDGVMAATAEVDGPPTPLLSSPLHHRHSSSTALTAGPRLASRGTLDDGHCSGHMAATLGDFPSHPPPPSSRHARRRRVAAQPSTTSSGGDGGGAAVSSTAHSPARHHRRRPSPPALPLTGIGVGGGGIAAYPSSPSDAEPTLRSVLSAACYILRHYFVRYSRSARRFFRRAARWIVLALLVAAAIVAVCAYSVIRGFYSDATALCTPPHGLDLSSSTGPPLVEYYVHGRGNGHYARSVAIIEKLNNAGIDVRLFIGRASMWRAVNEAAKKRGKEATSEKEGVAAVGGGASDGSAETDGNAAAGTTRGATTAISVTSITPSLPPLSALSHIVERLMGDCEVARATSRFPMLVITDGDLPGMLRAKLGMIPSVGISHGQTFAVAVKPPWVKDDARLDAAWEKQRATNRRAAYFSDWQIGTSFVAMETKQSSAVVARPPMRPEIVRMAAERRRRSTGATTATATETSPERRPVGNWSTKEGRIAELLLKTTDDAKLNSTTLFDKSAATNLPRRKVVICYFRDKNGDAVTSALLKSGVDVLLFEKGYHKGMMDIEVGGELRYGQKWVVRRENDPDSKGGHDAPKSPMEKGRGEMRRALKSIDESTPHRLLTDVHVTHPSPHQPRIIRVTDITLFVPLMSIADGVASSGGSQLLSECIYADIPLLTLYREGDTEQMLNVEMSRRMTSGDGGRVFGASFDAFSEAFSFVTADQKAGASPNFKIGHPASISFDAAALQPQRLLTDDQASLLLRSPRAKSAYSEFNNFVDAVANSAVSANYFADLSRGTGEEGKQAGRTGNEKANQIDADPFHGMPDAAAVISEIVKQVARGM